MKPTSLLIGAMSLLMATTAPQADASTPTSATAERRLDHCSWDRPGVDPFMGDVVAAVDHYRDLSPATREKFKARMTKRDYDEIVSIDRDGIRGKATYGATIRDMHFGTDQLCGNVTRASWKPDMKERGLVYCEGRECILVPTVCRNVSRISRAEVMAGTADEGDDAPGEPVAMGPALPAPADAPASGGGQPQAGGPGGGWGQPGSFAALSSAGAAGGGAGSFAHVARSTTREPSGEPAGPVPVVESDSPAHAPGAPDHLVPGLPDAMPALSAAPISAVPEPQSLLLMAAGLVVLAMASRRQRHAG